MKMQKPKTRSWALVLIALIAIFAAETLHYSSIFQSMELKLLDMRFALRGSIPLSHSPVVIVAIDDQSDESTPERWPWPRSYYAHIIENLEEAGAAAIGVDVLFDQPDSHSPADDDSLAAVLAKYDNIVLTGKLLATVGNVSYSTLIPPYKKFLNTKSPWGLVALEADLDGFFRRYPVIQAYNDSLLPSLAAQVLLSALPAGSPRKLNIDSDYFYVGPFRIPKYDDSGILINYIGPAHSFPYYSFDSVIDDKDFNLREDYDLNSFDDPGDSANGLPPGLKYSNAFKGKIVLIGSTMQELHDNFPTPFLEYRTSEGQKARAEMPGVEIHANAIYTILSGRYLLPLPEYYYILLIILFVGLTFLITRYLKASLGGIAVLLLMGLYIFLAFSLFFKQNLILSVSSPILAIIFGYIGFTLYNYILTQQEKRVLRGAFAYYVPEKVIQEIIENPEKLSLGGEERVITVLFSDVAGFTSISESLTPAELVALLNEYLTEMTDIVLANQGIIDKFEGDAIMAEFGAPVPYADHAKAACTAALEMQKRLRHLRKEWAKQGRPELYMRIGINTGEVIIGNMGSRDVFDYTVMGDHVNLGSRLEGANKYYGTYIMISEFTYAQVKDDFFTRPLDLIRVKGKKKPIEVFELLASKTTKFSDMFFKFMNYYTQGVEAYRERKWSKAVALFERCLKLNPDDKPAEIYLNRCRKYQQRPPDARWDGITTLTEK